MGTATGGSHVVAWTAQVAVLVGLTLGAAWAAHALGRSRDARARLRRALVHGAAPWIGAALVGVGAILFAVLARPREAPRRYADYLPDGGTRGGLGPAPGAVLATLLISGGLVLTAGWAWLRFGQLVDRRGWRLPQLVPAAGFVLLVAGLGVGWVADRTEPAAFGWFMYSPLSGHPVFAAPVDDRARILDGVAVALAVLGLGVLTVVAGYRAGRNEANAADGP